MNEMIAGTVLVALVTVGAFAQAKLIRLFVAEWRERRRREARRRLRPSSAGQGSAAAYGVARSRSVRILASLLGGVTASAAMAQSAPSQPASPQTPASETKQGETSLTKMATISAEPPAAIPAQAAPLVISTDRPSFSDGTGFVPIGHFQLETGATFTYRDRDDTETQRWNGPEVLARVALIEDRFEIRFITSGYVWSRTDGGSGFDASAGWGDVSLGAKLKVLDQDGWVPRLAIGAQTTVGGGSNSVSNQIAEPVIKLLWSYDMGQSMGEKWKGITVGGNANLAWPTTGGDRFLQGQGSIYIAFPVAEGLSGFAEYYVVGPNSKGTDAAHYVDFGGAYLLTDTVQLDARAGFGLNEEADNVFVGVGVSFLF